MEPSPTVSELTRDDPIFIAGHRGLIGSAFVRRLQVEGFRNLVRIPRSELDLRERPAVESVLHRTRPSLLLLCAAQVGGILENRDHPAEMITRNLEIELSVLQAAQNTGVPRVLFFGSSCMYPRECPQPMAETALLSGRPEPTSLPYAVAKLAGMEMCRAFNQQYGSTRFYSVIPNNAYGPGDDFDPESGHALSALIHRLHEARSSGAQSLTLWGRGGPRREFVHVDDVVDACCFLLEQREDPAEYPFNIGVGSDVSIEELARLIAAEVGYTGAIRFDPSRPDGAPRKLLDATRLMDLGWKPGIDLESGIRQSYEWYLEQRSREEHS
jgi:GDP-L-fucose synthase